MEIIIAFTTGILITFIMMKGKKKMTYASEDHQVSGSSPVQEPNSSYSPPKENTPDHDSIIITDEFQQAMDLVLKSDKNLFITGKAGTGKSTLLRLLRQKTDKKTVYLAPTGIAAINVQGQTIHSFFRFPPEIITQEHIEVDPQRRHIYRALETVVIDEISMVRADILFGIDHTLRIHRGSNEPFGGVQMIFFGDLHQLPPVTRGKDERNYFTDTYGGEYFFNNPGITTDTLTTIELTRIFRQQDTDFISLLNSVRENRVNPRELSILNSRVLDIPKPGRNNDELYITLTATNKVAETINLEKLASIPEEEAYYHAIVTGKFEESSYPTLGHLTLKPGAQIMMVKNDKNKQWVNGNIGTIVRLDEDIITVSIKGNEYEVEQETWEALEYTYDRQKHQLDKKVVGTFTQFPLKLAWAITIHKSQGQTFDNVIINLGNGAFTHGQTYVALSRCTSFEGLFLTKPIKLRDIKTDHRVISFMEFMTNENSVLFPQTLPQP